MTDEELSSGPEAAPVSDAALAPSPEPSSGGHVTDSVERAFARMAEMDKAAGNAGPEGGVSDAPQAEVKSGRERDEKGRFLSSQKAEAPAPENASDQPAAKPDKAPVEKPTVAAPAFINSAEAKAAWGETPEAVRADVERRFSEMTQGIERQRAVLEPLRDHIEFARANGFELPQLIEKWRNYETSFGQNPARTVAHIARGVGLDVSDLAIQLLDIADQPAPQPQTPAQASQQNPEVQQLQRQNQQLQQQLQQQQITSAVMDFRARNPDFSDLEAEIAQELRYTPRTGDVAADLQRAYDMVKLRRGPSQAPAQEAPPPPQQPSARTQQAALSVSGAPSGGSQPSLRRPASSNHEALQRAMRMLN